MTNQLSWESFGQRMTATLPARLGRQDLNLRTGNQSPVSFENDCSSPARRLPKRATGLEPATYVMARQCSTC